MSFVRNFKDWIVLTKSLKILQFILEITEILQFTTIIV